MKSLMAKLLQERDQGRGGELRSGWCQWCGAHAAELRERPGTMKCSRCQRTWRLALSGPLAALFRKP